MKKINSKSVKITKDHSESLRLYYQEIRNKTKNLISSEDEIKLFEEYQKTKSDEIKELLINNNLRFVLNVAKHYHHGNFFELTDIISSGNIGLIKAVENFDPYKGFKFSTYAIWWIRQSIIDGLIKESKLIKQPTKSHSINKKFLESREKFYNEYGFEPNVDDIKDSLDKDMATEILSKAINAIDDNNILSIFNSVPNSDNCNYEEILPTSIMNDDYIYKSSDLNSLSFDNLNKMQKIVINYTYGFNDKPELSFNQISELLQLPEKEIKKIHDKALKIIRNDL